MFIIHSADSRHCRGKINWEDSRHPEAASTNQSKKSTLGKFSPTHAHPFHTCPPAALTFTPNDLALSLSLQNLDTRHPRFPRLVSSTQRAQNRALTSHITAGAAMPRTRREAWIRNTRQTDPAWLPRFAAFFIRARPGILGRGDCREGCGEEKEKSGHFV